MGMKNDGWTNALFALVFLAVPGLLFIFWLFGLDGIDDNTGIQIGIGFGFVAYGILFSIFAIWIKWLSIDSLSFNIPITIVFGVLMMTNEGPIWLMAITAFAGVMTALPANSLVNWLKRRKK